MRLLNKDHNQVRTNQSGPGKFVFLIACVLIGLFAITISKCSENINREQSKTEQTDEKDS